MENTIDNARKFLDKKARELDYKSFAHLFGHSQNGMDEWLVAYAASVKPDGWRVKELVWEKSLVKYRIEAKCSIGKYQIYENDRPSVWLNNELLSAHRLIDLAKIAAQKDLDERIWKSLEPC